MKRWAILFFSVIMGISAALLYAGKIGMPALPPQNTVTRSVYDSLKMGLVVDSLLVFYSITFLFCLVLARAWMTPQDVDQVRLANRIMTARINLVAGIFLTGSRWQMLAASLGSSTSHAIHIVFGVLLFCLGVRSVLRLAKQNNRGVLPVLFGFTS